MSRFVSVRVEIELDDVAGDLEAREAGVQLAEIARRALEGYGNVQIASYVLRRL